MKNNTYAAPKSPTPSKADKIKITVVVSVLFIIFTACMFFGLNLKKDFNDTHAQVGEIHYSLDESVLVFSSADIDTINEIKRFKNPESIDLRGSNVSLEDTLELMEFFPECDIRWNIPIASSTDSYAEEIRLSSINKEDIRLLSYLPNLNYIDARGLDLDIIKEIKNLRPECSLDWDLKIGEARYPHDTEVISLTDATVEEIQSLIHLENLKKVNAAECPQIEALLELSGKMPECEFLWTAELFGIKADSAVTELNFNRKKVEDIAALDKEFEEKLKYFPNLKTIDMCGCGVPSEQMAKWRDKYPHIKFIWEITFGKKYINWTVRTDIKVFSTLLGSVRKVGDQEMFKELLLYCTDLVVLDLGHNEITDISLFTNLKNLQGLILTDNPISDFSPIAELPNIQFLELNMTHVSDLTPFKECKNLKHLDVYYTRIRDLSPLYECDNLEYLILATNDLSTEQKKEIRKKLPNCKIAHTLKNNDTYTRNNPMRCSFRLALKNYDLLEDFVDWEHVTYKEGAKLVYPRGYIKY